MILGDFDASAIIYHKFTTFRPSTGAPFTFAGSPALSVYKDNSATQSTTGVTLTADFDSVTGLNHVAIDTSADGTFYAAGSFFDIVITTGTVDSVSAVGVVVGRFTLRKNSALKPATAGRTVVVDAAGLVDANAVKVGPTGSGTAQTAGDIMADTNDIQARLPAALVGGRMDSSVGAMAADVVTASAIATDAIGSNELAASAVTEIQTGLATPTNITAGTITTVTNLTNAPTNGDLTATMKTSVQIAADSAMTANALLNAIAAYIDTEVAAIKAKTDNLPASPAAVGSAMTLTGGERDSIAAALLDLAAGVETGLTLRQLCRILAAAEAGKLSGAATTTIKIRNTADSKDRITATVDADGNRSAITLDLT